MAFSLPCIILGILPGLGRFSVGICRTTISLNYGPIGTFFGIILPGVAANVVANLMVDFALSLSSFVVSCFAGNPDFRALPVCVFSLAGGEMGPSVCTLSALVFLIILILLVLVGVTRDGTRGEGKRNE